MRVGDDSNDSEDREDSNDSNESCGYCVAARRHVRSGRGQAGTTLIEVLVVVAILGPLVASATMGLLATMRMSDSTRTLQELQASAASFSETLKEAPYVDCAGVSSYDGADGLWTKPPGRSISITLTSVRHWSQADGQFVAAGGPDDPCPADQGAQLITVQLTERGARAVLDVVKRDPAASPAGAP